MVCYKYFVQGQYKNDSYYFCSFVPTYVDYSYKDGVWRFWNNNGQLVAEGPYIPKKQEITDRGGCPYEIFEGVMDESTWKFWDNEGQRISSNKEFIEEINLCVNELL